MSYVMISNQFLAAFNLIKCFGVISILSLYPFIFSSFSLLLCISISLSLNVFLRSLIGLCALNFGHPALTF